MHHHQLTRRAQAGITQHPAHAAGAAAERARLRTILTSPAARANRAAADELAFRSDLGAEAAVALLGRLVGASFAKQRPGRA